MQLQGWPLMDPKYASLLQEFEDSKLMTLAGNAFPVTVICSILCGMMFSYSSHREASDQAWQSGLEEVASASQLLKTALASSGSGGQR